PPSPLYTLSLPDALPISATAARSPRAPPVWVLRSAVPRKSAQQLGGSVALFSARALPMHGAPAWERPAQAAASAAGSAVAPPCRSEEHTSELQSPYDLVC